MDPTPPQAIATPTPASQPLATAPPPGSVALATPLPQVDTLSASTATTPPDTATLYAQALDQINGVRLQQGLSPVTLGFNAAAQAHADELHGAQYLSHWNREGLAPYMRYTLAGGQGYSAENVAYIGRLTDQQCVPHEVADWQDQIFAGLMTSPGHRDNILNPHHTIVNLGIVHACHLLVMVQLFEGDYVEFTFVPRIVNGLLSLQGNTRHGTSLQDYLVIYWDPIPYTLSREQLLHSSCYGAGIPVAMVLAPLENPNAYYVDDQTRMDRERCMSPYDVSIVDRFPETPEALNALYQQIKSQPRIQESFVVPYYIADVLDTGAAAFHVQANITSLLERQGPGVYSVSLHGYRDHAPEESILLSAYSIWVR